MPDYRIGTLSSTELGLNTKCIVQNVSWHLEADFDPNLNSRGDVMGVDRRNDRCDLAASVVIPLETTIPVPGWQLRVSGLSLGGRVSPYVSTSGFTVKTIDVVFANKDTRTLSLTGFCYYNTPAPDEGGFVLTDENFTEEYDHPVFGFTVYSLHRTVETRTYRRLIPPNQSAPTGWGAMTGNNVGPISSGSQTGVIVNRWICIDRGTARAYIQTGAKEYWETWQRTGAWEQLSSYQWLVLNNS